MIHDNEFNDDPLFCMKRKTVKIIDFLILKKKEKEKSMYLIKKFESGPNETLEALKFFKEALDSFNDLNPQQKIEFCSRQREIMKLYLKCLRYRDKI